MCVIARVQSMQHLLSRCGMSLLVDFPEEIERTGPPNKFDLAPYMTRCKVLQPDGTYNIYVQTSPLSETPRWELQN